MILGVDLDLFEKHIPTLARESGIGASAEQRLRDLLVEIRSIIDARAPIIPEQHVVSKVVLKRFCLPPAGPAGQQLQPFDLVQGIPAARRTPSAVGKVVNFVQIDSKTTEELWGTVETRLDGALAAAASRTIFSHPEHVATIKSAIALHFARSLEVQEISDQIWSHGLNRARQAFLGIPDLSAAAFENRYGLVAAGAEARALGADDLISRTLGLYESGTIFRLRVQALFEQARDRVASAGLEILEPEEGEYLIGDTPVITVDHNRRLIGLRAGVAFNEANTVVMPIGRDRFAALGPHDKWGTMPKALVTEVNRWQVLAARDRVFYFPGAGFDSFIVATRAQSASGPSSAP